MNQKKAKKLRKITNPSREDSGPAERLYRKCKRIYDTLPSCQRAAFIQNVKTVLSAQ